MKIKAQKHGEWNAADRAEMVKALGKLGYTVRTAKEKNSAGKYEWFVEAWGDGESIQQVPER